MAEGERLGAELRIGAGADEHEVSNEAGELLELSLRSMPAILPNRPDDPRAVQPAQPKTRYARPTPGAPIELTAQGLRNRV